VSSPYRNEVDALRERKEAIEREIARLREQTTELEALRARERELANELASIDQKLGATKRKLPLLDRITVASPCHASWDEMLGDDRVRFCLSCEKNVYNLSAMTREEAERLLQERGDDLCVRFYQRADGTIMTQDCPVGARKKRRKKLALAVAGAGAMAFAATSMLTRGDTCAVQGELVVQPPGTEPTTAHVFEPPVPHVMGTVAPPVDETPPPPPKPRTTTPIKRVTMGKPMPVPARKSSDLR